MGGLASYKNSYGTLCWWIWSLTITIVEILIYFSEPRLRYTFKDINFTVYMSKDIDLILFFLYLTYYYYYLLIIIKSST